LWPLACRGPSHTRRGHTTRTDRMRRTYWHELHMISDVGKAECWAISCILGSRISLFSSVSPLSTYSLY
jgi:hypothetical protein